MKLSPPIVFAIFIGIAAPGLVIGGRELALLSVVSCVGMLVYSFWLAIKVMKDANRK